MTCIAAIVDDGRIHFAADRFTGAGARIIRDQQPKLLRHPSGVLIGCCGAASASQTLRYAFEPPSRRALDDDEAYAFGTFFPRLNAELARAIPSDELVEYLCGIDGRLYHGYSSGFVTEVHDHGAVGSGADVALGALAMPLDASPRQRLRAALVASERHISSVRGPFDFRAGSCRLRVEPAPDAAAHLLTVP